MTLWKLTGSGMYIQAVVVFAHGDDKDLAKVYGLTLLEHSGLCNMNPDDYTIESCGVIKSKDVKIGNVIHLDNGDY